ncbi:hypothetical protein F0562_000663 [Nyssa sinensis]|uniref:Bet v I/Major latex protein domain-containing protein n=1 Tax=Nyssa sinensis TaxID=561372 RepID=A0A5J5C164_9ASTE|nr:hypothetical protein F0562_000663 [Nyssa sinensis]
METLEASNKLTSLMVMYWEDKLKSIAYEVKFEASDNGGSICKMTSEYHAAGDVELKEEEIKGGKDRAMATSKVVEAYLLENPDVYA